MPNLSSSAEVQEVPQSWLGAFMKNNNAFCFFWREMSCSCRMKPVVLNGLVDWWSSKAVICSTGVSSLFSLSKQNFSWCWCVNHILMSGTALRLSVVSTSIAFVCFFVKNCYLNCSFKLTDKWLRVAVWIKLTRSKVQYHWGAGPRKRLYLYVSSGVMQVLWTAISHLAQFLWKS